MRTVNEFKKSHQLYCTVLHLICEDFGTLEMSVYHCFFVCCVNIIS